MSDRDGNDEIYIIDADGSNPTRVTNHPESDFESSWTSEGTRLIFDSDRQGNWDLYSIGVDGKDLVQLTNHIDDDEQPAWSP